MHHMSCHIDYDNTKIKTHCLINVKTFDAKVLQPGKEKKRR